MPQCTFSLHFKNSKLNLHNQIREEKKRIREEKLQAKLDKKLARKLKQKQQRQQHHLQLQQLQQQLQHSDHLDTSGSDSDAEKSSSMKKLSVFQKKQVIVLLSDKISSNTKYSFWIRATKSNPI